MANEEKAREIAEKNACDYPFRGGLTNTSRAECEDSALEMAEWKDAQFKEYLEKKLESIRDCFQKSISEYKKDYCFTQMVIVAEIINELFSEPKEQDNSDREE